MIGAHSSRREAGATRMPQWPKDLVLLVGRVFMAGQFIYDSKGVIEQWQRAAAAYVTPFGFPPQTIWLVVALHLGGGILVVLGYFTRPVALLFAAFCIASAVLFHRNFASSSEVIQFGKDIGLAGGFLYLMVFGAGGLSLDARLRHKH
jgi:putative oxidoreductase